MLLRAPQIFAYQIVLVLYSPLKKVVLDHKLSDEEILSSIIRLSKLG